MSDLLAEFYTLILFIVFTAGFFGFYTISDKLGKRKAIEQRIDKLTRQITGEVVEGEEIEQTFINNIFILLENFYISAGVLGDEKTRKLSRFLMKAGWRSPRAPVIYISARIFLPITLAVLFYGFRVFPLFSEFSFNQMLWICIVGFGIGMYIPEFIVKKATTKYRDSIRRGLPDALDLMVICFEAGYSNDATLRKIAEEYGKQNPQLAGEFDITATELRLLPDRRTAWTNLGERIDLGEVRAVVTAMQQNDKYGTPLAKALKTQIEVFRKERILRAEEKAARLPVLLTIPLLVFFFPIILVVVLTPSILRTIYTLQGFPLFNN